MIQNTIDLINKLTTEVQNKYRVLDVCRFGFIVKNHHTNLITVQDKYWVMKHSKQIENFIHIVDDNPLLHITEIPYVEGSEEKITDAYYLGEKLVNIEVVFDILDKEPNVRSYSTATVSLNGKAIKGTVKDIRLEIEESRYQKEPRYSNCNVTLEYVGYIDKNYYSHALTNERGKFVRNENGDLLFLKQKIEQFRQYRSGCGKAEHYHIPGSDYKKYVEVMAILPLEIGEEVVINYNVSDDPEFVRKQKINSCSKDINITTKTIVEADCDGVYEETISNAKIYLSSYKSEYSICVSYIPDECKYHHKAIEYEKNMSLDRFCNMLKEKYTVPNETLLEVITVAKNVCDIAKQHGFIVIKEDVSFISSMIIN